MVSRDGDEVRWIRRGKGAVGLTTPPPPRRDSLAALTMEVVARVVMEVRIREILALRVADGVGRLEESAGWSLPDA